MKYKSKKILTMALCLILTLHSSAVMVQASNATQQTKDAQQESTVQDDVAWPEEPSTTAGAAVVMEVETGVVLYEKNASEKHYPASITKILTTLVALENASLSETVLFSKDAVFNIERGSSICAIDWGEEVSLEDCLYGIMLESGNDAAYAVAEHIGGTYENFITMMNAKAKELGCLNSHFENPHGLTEEGHYTSAYDMALISQAAIKNSEFAKITGTRIHSVAPTNKQPETRHWLNHHKFVKRELNYEGAIGGKTGWTTKSKYTLVTYAKRNNMTLVCVIMNEANPIGQYTETAKLLDYGFDNFTLHNVKDAENNPLVEDQAFFSEYNSVFSSTAPMLSVSEDGYVLLPNGIDISDTTKEVVYQDATSQSEDSTSSSSGIQSLKQIGTVSYNYGNRKIGKGNILINISESELPTMIHMAIESQEDVVNEDTGNQNTGSKTVSNSSSLSTIDKEKEQKNLKPLIVFIIIGSIVILILLYYFIVERPRIRRRKAYLERRKNHRYYS